MARQLRISYSGAIYHITSRGNNRQNIYLNDNDRVVFLDIFAKIVKHYNWICHSYCLMDNHYHLLIETLDPNLSEGMQRLNGLYSQKFNKINNRVGHLFQGRFKSILVERESYLLELSRYIVLNPVRANMVVLPDEYKWSSFRAFLGLETCPAFLSTDWVLNQFSENSIVARSNFCDFILEGIGQENMRIDLETTVVLGGREFVNELKELKIQRTEVPIKQQSQIHKPLDQFVAQVDIGTRNNLIRSLYSEHRFKMIEIAKAFGLHYTTVSKIIKLDSKLIFQDVTPLASKDLST